MQDYYVRQFLNRSVKKVELLSKQVLRVVGEWNNTFFPVRLNAFTTLAMDSFIRLDRTPIILSISVKKVFQFEDTLFIYKSDIFR